MPASVSLPHPLGLRPFSQALEANALRIVLIALGGEHREWIQYGTTALALGQLVALACYFGTRRQPHSAMQQSSA